MSGVLTVGLWKTGELILDFGGSVDIEGALIIARGDRDTLLHVLGMHAPEYQVPDWNEYETDDEKIEKAIEFSGLIKHDVCGLEVGNEN